MAKLQTINAVLLILILIYALFDINAVAGNEFNDTEHFNAIPPSTIEGERIDKFLLTADQTSGYNATVVDITNLYRTNDTANATISTAESDDSTTNTTEVASEPVVESTIVHDLIQTKKSPIKCKDGLILRAWPIENITYGDRFARGMAYFFVLIYLFIGVSIASDRFMAAIEKITAIEKEVTVRRSDGSKQIVIVRVWNETVANLTLMALGMCTVHHRY